MKAEITLLQKEMERLSLDICYITSSDYHASEYVNAHFHYRKYLSGFTGSAATMIVTKDFAGLWTDSRYYIQAGNQLAGSGITLFRQGERDVPSPEVYLQSILTEGVRLGVDCRTISLELGQKLKAMTAEKGGEVVHADTAATVWKGRPPLQGTPLFAPESRFTGKTTAEKLADIRNTLAEKHADLHVLGVLDDIAWIMNLRGGDVAYTPVFYSYLILTAETACLYLLEEAYSASLVEELASIGVQICPYDDFFTDLEILSKGKSVLIDASTASYRLCQILESSAEKIIKGKNPSTMMKAIKNEAECIAARDAHHRDGIAMVEFLYWLKQNIGVIPMSEISASDYLEERRRANGAIDLSFDTIAGYGPHAAIVHYSATPETDATLKPEGLFLVDSGGQYPSGTTDITRTVALGPLTREMKEHFTLVLRGMIDLAMIRFPEGLTGENLDVLAHAPLWSRNLDFLHGTGHGVGQLLSVHEGPNHFSWRIRSGSLSPAFRPGMITTDEPGFYLEGEHGIRIENELLCIAADDTYYGKFLAFEVLTLCPIDREAILPEMLTRYELDWLNQYHERVWTSLKDELTPEISGWLYEVTRPL